jgi:hypothetical protein
MLQLAGASDDKADDVSGSCDEAEHAADAECAGLTPTSDVVDDDDDTTSTTDDQGVPADDIRSLDAAGAGTVIYAIESGSLRLVTATPSNGWAVEVEQASGQEIELDFRSGTQRVQVNVEIEDGDVRERVRLRDDADDTDVRTEDGVVQDDNSGPGNASDDVADDNSGPGSDDTTADDSSDSGPGSGTDDSVDDHSGHDGSDDGSGHDAADDSSGSGHGGDD